MSKNAEDRILTVPNVISVFRILLIPVFVFLLFKNQNIAAFIIFVVACISDGVDGYIARHFNQASNLGKILDPIADRGLLLIGSIVLCLLGRLPVWIVVLVIIRDFTFLFGGLYLIRKCNFMPSVIMLGKIATCFFYVGFAILVLGDVSWLMVPGFNIINVGWLPGFASGVYSVGIWPIYIGILLNIYTSTYYIKEAYTIYKEATNARC